VIEAVRRNDASRWQAQLRAKADVECADSNGNTCAANSAALNYDVAARMSLLAAGAKVNAKNAADATA